tara:strand:+ start:2250 stop:2867 length:618 start_codon:yes stop_codon:yes gene_type:complete
MNLDYHYWLFKNIVPHRYCDNIIRYAYERNKIQKGLTAWGDPNFKQKILNNDPEALKVQHKIRRSEVVWLDKTWIYKLIKPAFLLANKNAGWNFKIDDFESCQFTIYKEDNYYEWHKDSYDKHAQKDRKLSASLLLNNPDEYEGGDFEFKYQTNPNADTRTESVKNDLLKGSLIVFPSFVFHRVKPVIKGTRHSLVIWSRGPRFS